MDLTSPLRTLIPSLDSAVLEVLARGQSGLSASQIAKLSRRGTRAGQSAVLTRLVEHGLVIADPANTGHLYRLNRAHVLAPAVLAAAGARQEIIDRLSAAIADLDPAPMHASVFGSFARRQSTAQSDIDLLLVVADHAELPQAQWTDGLDTLVDAVAEWTGNRLEVLTFTESRVIELSVAGEPIVKAWTDESITVHGPVFSRLLESAGAPA